MDIRHATTDEEILSCFPVMQVLRPHLAEADFLTQVRRQEQAGYHLIFVTAEDQVAAAAGYRISEFLAWGKILYLDDLICAPQSRRSGHGGALLDWLILHAKSQGCQQLHLDSGHQRHDAHRLYLNKGMKISSHHFSIDLT